MSNWIQRTGIAAAAILLLATGVYASTATEESETDISLNNYAFIEEMKLNSTRYTQVDDLSPVDPAFFVTLDADDDKIAENASQELYYDDEFLSFKVRNKTTGYVWSTNIDDPQAGTFNPLLQSGIGIAYLNVQKAMEVTDNVGLADTQYAVVETPIENGIRLDITISGKCARSACERFYPDYLAGDVTEEEMIRYGLTLIDIGFALEVTLTEDGLQAHVPFESIVENNPDEVLLSSIILFPALGATHMDDIPGYMVLPEGSGALIRYEDNEGASIAPFTERFYGGNYGLFEARDSVLNYALSMPIFGAVHGVNQNAMLAILEEGALNARLVAMPNGALNTPYNLIFTKVDYRQAFTQFFTTDRSASAIRQLQSSTTDTTIQYQFLDGDDANYVGIGSAYRGYLMDNGALVQQSPRTDVPIHIEYFMSDSESTFFGSRIVATSTVDDVTAMYDELVAAGVAAQHVVLTGWNDGGFSGRLPIGWDTERKLGSRRDFEALIDHIRSTNPVTLTNNFVMASANTDGVRYRSDVARGVNRFKLEWECDVCVVEDRYLLYPEASRDFALAYLDEFQDLGVNVRLSMLGSTLFSAYDSGFLLREDAYRTYLDVMEAYDGMGNYVHPFAYAFGYTDAYYNAPLYNSQLKYYDDLVPLLQVVLHGTMDLFGPHLNYNSLGREQVLALIDFGVQPSFVLTKTPSSALKNTDSSELFTTEYALWKNSIVDNYTYINDALRHVDGALITARTVLDPGIVRIEYSNGVTIHVNYTSTAYDLGTTIVPALDYVVGGDGA